MDLNEKKKALRLLSYGLYIGTSHTDSVRFDIDSFIPADRPQRGKTLKGVRDGAI